MSAPTCNNTECECTEFVVEPAKEKTFTQFVRDRKGQPRGIVVGKLVNDEFIVGWAFAHKKAGDGFNKKRALDMAHGRLERGTDKTVPHDVNKVAGNLYQTAQKYYSVCATRDDFKNFKLVIVGKAPPSNDDVPF